MLAIRTHDPCFGRKHVANGRQGLLGLALLNEAHQRLDNNNSENDASIHPVAQARRDYGGPCQYVNQEILELPSQSRPRPLCTSLRQSIWAMAGQALANLILRQGLLCFELLPCFRGLKHMPLRLPLLALAVFQDHRFRHPLRAPCHCNTPLNPGKHPGWFALHQRQNSQGTGRTSYPMLVSCTVRFPGPGNTRREAVRLASI